MQYCVGFAGEAGEAGEAKLNASLHFSPCSKSLPQPRNSKTYAVLRRDGFFRGENLLYLVKLLWWTTSPFKVGKNFPQKIHFSSLISVLLVSPGKL
jgi:hypothetical protein